MPDRAIVCDTTVLLYLGRIGHLELIPALFAPVHVPEQVVLELDMGRLTRSDTVDPRDVGWASVVPVSRADFEGCRRIDWGWENGR